MPLTDYAQGSKNRVVCELLIETIRAYGAGQGKRALITRARIDHSGKVGVGNLVFMTNVGGARVPKPLSEQQEAFTRVLNTVYDVALQEATSSQDDGTKYCKTCGKEVVATDAVWYAEAEQCAKCYKLAAKKPKKGKQSDCLVTAHKEWSQAARAFCEQRSADGRAVWDWGMRNTLDGAALILAGLEESRETGEAVAEAVRDACTMHLGNDIRVELGVREEFDFGGFGVPRYLEIGSRARVPLPGNLSRSVCMMLIGPMGSGKSTAAAQLARNLDLPYGKVSMTRGTSPTAFNGKQRVTDDGSLLGVLHAIAQGEHAKAGELAQKAMQAGDVTVSQWVRIYGGGGVFLFDEIDAADSNLLLIVNDALSSEGFTNTATGETVMRSEKFIGVAAGNTNGLGANPIYGGRERLDGASLDRWAAGRVRVGYDNELESGIIDSMLAGAVK